LAISVSISNRHWREASAYPVAAYLPEYWTVDRLGGFTIYH
jgi:hypothetical protein